MTQQPYPSQPYGHSRPKTSGLAVGAIVLGALAIIPLLGLLLGFIGLILGVIALITISGSQGRRKGSGLAIGGIIMSLLFPIIGTGIVIAVFMPTIKQGIEFGQHAVVVGTMREYGRAQEEIKDGTGRYGSFSDLKGHFQEPELLESISDGKPFLGYVWVEQEATSDSYGLGARPSKGNGTAFFTNETGEMWQRHVQEGEDISWDPDAPGWGPLEGAFAQP